MGRLPHIDEHCITVRAGREQAWAQLWPVVSGAMSSDPLKRGYARAIGSAYVESSGGEMRLGSTVVGFRVTAIEPRQLLVLAGRHRFSSYELIFRLTPAGDGTTRICGETRATFPGVAGQAYKTLVIRSRLHVVVTRRLLAAVKRRAERDGAVTR